MNRLAVVIPCHRRWDLLPGAIDAVLGSTERDCMVVVVNDSPPGSEAPPMDGVVLVRTPGTQGFARAVNAGMIHAQKLGATHVLLLNDDAQPSGDCVEVLCASWTVGVGAVGPVLVRPGGAVESAGVDVHWWGRVVHRRRMPTPGVEDVDALSGACMLLSSDARLDEGFVHGFEDIALCMSMRRSGQRVLLAGAARCVHLGGATLPRRDPQAQRHAVSGHLRLLRHRRYLPVVTLLAAAQVIREGGPLGRMQGIWAGVQDWRSG